MVFGRYVSAISDRTRQGYIPSTFVKVNAGGQTEQLDKPANGNSEAQNNKENNYEEESEDTEESESEEEAAPENTQGN